MIKKIVILVGGLLIITFGYWETHRYMVANYIRNTLAKKEDVSINEVKVDRIELYGSLIHKLNPFSPQFWSIDYDIQSKDTGGAKIDIEELNFGQFHIQNKPYTPEEMKQIINRPD